MAFIPLTWSVFGHLLPWREDSLPLEFQEALRVWLSLVCLLIILVRFLFGIFLYLPRSRTNITNNMASTCSTPLDLSLAHWQDVRDNMSNNSVTVKKPKWVTFCSVE